MPQNLLACHGVVGLICAVGEGGAIRHFAGDLYEPRGVESPTVNTLRAVFVDSPHSAWAVGDAGTVLHWNGRCWLPAALASRHDDLLAVWGRGRDVWIGGQHRLLLHRPLSTGGMIVSTQHTIRSISGSGPADLWLLADENTAIHIGGDRYHDMPMAKLESDCFNAIGGTDSENVFAVGDLGVVARWDGSEWRDVPSTTGDTFTAVCGGDAGDIWATTAAGDLWRLTGAGWERAASLPYALNGVCFVDGVVWACGERGIVMQHLPEEGSGE
ncbi:MAG: hypothetical protein HY369_02840 [Candidatus Aenigmarchaeota archaeon]|nr:hypothetical protein [Candidatus Aenigmarchaeota archaeon]